MVLDAFPWLNQISASHRTTVGDKAFHLGLALQQGHAVIPGFVVPATALRHFLGQVSWQEQLFTDLPHSFLYIDADNPLQLQAVAQQIRQAIESTPLPEALWAELEAKVQSWSAPAVIFRASFALRSGLDPTVSSKSLGLLASHICRSDREALATGLKHAWSELFRARSLFYWQRLGVQLQDVQLAVLVQPIRSVRAAGELRSIGSQIEIRAVRGLGHALIHNATDNYTYDPRVGLQRQLRENQPYTYRVMGADGAGRYPALTNWLIDEQACLQLDLIEPAQQMQPVLSSEQFQKLITLAQQVTADFNMPLALEWILDDLDDSYQGLATGGFCLTQIIPLFNVSTQAIELAAVTPAVQPTRSNAFPNAMRLEGLAAAPGKAIAPAWVLDSAANLASVPAGTIVIATTITPQQVMQLRQAAGIVAEQGGMTSHAAILARELQIPAVVGVAKATQTVKTNDRVAIDGDQGTVYYGVEVTSDWPEARGFTLPPVVRTDARVSITPRTQLYATYSQLDHLAQIAALPVDGVGLLRSEMLLLDWLDPDSLAGLQQPTAKLAEQIADRLQQFAAAFAPRPVFYRSLDLQMPILPSASGTTAPICTALGIRGSLSYQYYPDLFKAQLAALRQVQQQGYSNISLVLPFVRTVEEFIFCRQQVEQMGLMQDPQFQLWIMAEVPSVLFLLADYVAAGLQGISIGMNDLTQLLLAADRDHPQMATAFNPMHPAVLRAVQQLIQTARSLRISCNLCGQINSPDLIMSLLEWGITAISVAPSEIETVYEAMQQFYIAAEMGL